MRVVATSTRPPGHRTTAGAELLVRHDPPAQLLGEGARERDAVALDRDVEVEPRLAQQDVAHGAADEVDAVEAAG